MPASTGSVAGAQPGAAAAPRKRVNGDIDEALSLPIRKHVAYPAGRLRLLGPSQAAGRGREHPASDQYDPGGGVANVSQLAAEHTDQPGGNPALFTGRV